MTSSLEGLCLFDDRKLLKYEDLRVGRVNDASERAAYLVS